MSFFQDPPRYHTLLVTFWEERNQDPNLANVWRFRLENPRTGERWGFAGLEALMTTLQQLMANIKEASSDENPSSPGRGPPRKDK